MAYNEGWTPNFNDYEQECYIPTFSIKENKSGIDYFNVEKISDLDVKTFHLCCKTEDLAKYFGKQFKHFWTDYLLI